MTKNLSNWTVMTDDFYTQGCPETAAAHLAGHIEDAIRQEGQEQHFSVVKISPEGSVVVRCDSDFGSRLGNLPAARYATPVLPAAPKAAAFKPK